MWTRTYSKTFPGLKPLDVWRVWTDIDQWPAWHGDLDYCKLENDFAVGHYFWLKPKGMKAVKIQLTAIDKGKSFTDCTTFPGAKMYDTHRMEKTPEGLKLTNTNWVTGPLAWVWIWLVARHVAASIPEETEALVRWIQAHER